MINGLYAQRTAGKFGKYVVLRSAGPPPQIECPSIGTLRGLFAIAFAVVLAMLQGCSSRPRDVVAPSIDADAAADRALELYDKNSDDLLDKMELEACPGMLAAMKVYDTDGDQSINFEEIVNRIALWKTSGPAMMTVDCRVTLDGRPLVGATVRFAPEPYLEGALHGGSGISGENGLTTVSIAPEDLPKELRRIRAMNSGTYKVEITHPATKIPEKYNTQTTLGREVSRQTTASPYEQFDLKSK